MKLTIKVATKRGIHQFAVIIHALDSPDQFHMDPVGFYEKYSKSIPRGIHHELEIVEPDESLFERHFLHVHKSRKTGKLFICYPLHVPDTQKAREVFETWCLGSVATIEEGVDLNTIYSAECDNDRWKFISLMRSRYGIYVALERSE